MKFLESLINYDKDNIPEKIIKKLTDVILGDENFDPDKIKVASTACEGNLTEINNKLIINCRYLKLLKSIDNFCRVRIQSDFKMMCRRHK